jgi:hypothetical protein
MTIGFLTRGAKLIEQQIILQRWLFVEMMWFYGQLIFHIASAISFKMMPEERNIQDGDIVMD